MKINFALTNVVVVLAISGICVVAVAQEPPKPGPEHKILTQDVGKWKTSVEMFMPGEDEPMKSEGTEECVAVCGGLFLQTKYSGEIANTPFEGWALVGYDIHKQKYTGSWIDNWGTAQYQLEGSYDEKTKTMTMMLTGPDPATGQPLTQKHVTNHIDTYTKTLDIYMADPTGQSDEMVKTLALRSERQK